MGDIPALFLAAALGVGGLVATALWSRREVWAKVIILAGAFATLAVLYAGLLDLLSRPKPMGFGLLGAAEAQVLSHQLHEGEAIYLWLALPGAAEPRYFVMPWDRQRAEELQEAQEGAGNKGEVRMRQEPSLEEREPMFYAPPQEALPEKAVPPAPMEVMP